MSVSYFYIVELEFTGVYIIFQNLDSVYSLETLHLWFEKNEKTIFFLAKTSFLQPLKSLHIA